MTTTSCAAPAATARPPLLSRALLLRFATVLGASSSFFLLLAVVPLYAAGSGGDPGLATGSLMLATVLGELATPRLVARFGYRWALSAGLTLMGGPALVLTVSGSTVWITAVCLARGLGFALTVVAGGALTVSLIPAERRGEGLALAGIVSGVPSLLGLPLGVWLAGHVGYGPVCAAGGLAALVAVAAVPGMPARSPAGREGREKRHAGVVAGMRTGALARPTAVFAATALGAGVIVTFLPAAVPASMSGLVAAALFVQPAASTAARWFAGRIGDRRGPAGLVLPGLLASAAGLAVTALTGSAAAVLAGVALFGAGFGIAQNATLTLMYTRVSADGYGTVSALWNVAYDGGMGAGAVGCGAVAAGTGFPAAFALTAALMLLALGPARRDRKAPAPSDARP